MNKDKLIEFIDKYYLNGRIEAVKWHIKEDNSLETIFFSQDKTMVGDVTLKEFGYLKPDTIIAILTTSQLLKQLTVLDDEIFIEGSTIEMDGEVKYQSLVFINKSKNDKIDYMLSDIVVINAPKAKGIKVTPEYELDLQISKRFIEKFLKAKAALPDTTLVTFKRKDETTYDAIFGYSNISTNRINIEIKVIETKPIDRLISFSSDFLKDIFSVNKNEDKIGFKISNTGLGHVFIDNDMYKANYYLVESETGN